jgi:hypothetical protein
LHFNEGGDMKDSAEKKIKFVSSVVGVIPNVVLTEKERKEVEDCIKDIKKIKMKKKCYFSGFVEKD